MRQAIELHGTMYVDATVIKHEGSIHRTNANENEQRSDSPTSGGDHTSTDDDSTKSMKRSEGETEAKPCRIMASSCAQGNMSFPQVGVSAKFVRSLLRKYGPGKIWVFDEEGDASDGDESSDSGLGGKISHHAVQDGTPNGVAPKADPKHSRIEEAKEIQRLFSGVRSLAIVGMWDHRKARWMAACILWSYSPLQVLSEELLRFVTAFNDALLVEIYRLEALSSDRSKVSKVTGKPSPICETAR